MDKRIPEWERDLWRPNIEEVIQELRTATRKAIFDHNTSFKEWVEGTTLFHSLVKNSGNPLCEGIDAADGSFSLDTKGVSVKTVYDLPFELIVEFWKNSPFYNPIDNNQILLDVTDDKTKEIIS